MKRESRGEVKALPIVAAETAKSERAAADALIVRFLTILGPYRRQNVFPPPLPSNYGIQYHRTYPTPISNLSDCHVTVQQCALCGDIILFSSCSSVQTS
jgi:hypothetical protein